MFYEINLKKLNKIIGENIKFDNCENLMNKIAGYIKEGNVGNPEKNMEDKILRYATELIINQKEQKTPINLNLGNEEGLPDEIFKDWKSVSEYIASRYNGVDKVNCHIEGKEEVIGALFGKFSEKIVATKGLMADNEKTIISWDIPRAMLVKSWGDKGYVLKKIKNTRDEYLKETFNLIADELWEDKSFISELFVHKSTKIKEYIPERVIKSKKFTEYLCENLRELVVFWESNNGYGKCASDIMDEIYNKLINKYVSEEKIPNGTSLLSYIKEVEVNEKNEFIVEEEYNKKVYSKSDIENLEYIYQNVFSNKEKCKQLIISKNFYEEDIRQYFSPELQMDEEIIDLMAVEKYKNIYGNTSILNYIPKEYFDDKERTKSLLKKHIGIMFENSEEKLPSKIKEYFNDKELCIELIKKAEIIYEKSTHPNNTLRKLKEAIPKNIFSSKEVLKILIETGDPDVSYLDSDNINKSHMKMIMGDKDIQEFILEKNRFDIFSRLSKEIIYQQTNKEHIKRIVSKNYELLRSDKVPKEWMEDIDIVCAIENNIRWLNLNKTEIKKLCTTKDNVKRLLKINPILIFEKLPKEMKLDKELILYSLSTLKEKNELNYHAESIIDKSLWASYDFCYKALEVDDIFCKKIPENYWISQDFIMGLFKGMDDGKIRPQVINVFPTKIKQCLDAFDISVGGYSDFADKFFMQQNLEQNLSIEEPHIKIKKMKI